MTLTQLNYIYWVDKCGSFRRAAKELGVSQPSITESIHALESELNRPIFQRRGSQMVMTEAGSRILQTAKLFKNEEARLFEDLDAMVKINGASVRLSVCLYQELPLKIAKRFEETHPNISVTIDQCNALHVIQALDGEECDLGITYTELLTGRQASVHYGFQEFGVFFPKNHHFSSFSSVPQESVANELSHQTDDANTESLLVGGHNLSVTFRPGLDPMLESIQARINKKITILPLNWHDDTGSLISRPLAPPLHVPLSLAWNPKHFQSREVLEFKSLLTSSNNSDSTIF
jgi:molybdate transport repressor ModE-like protein